MSIVLNGTTGITNDSGYTGDGVSFADSTPANTLVTTSGGNVGMGTSSPSGKVQITGASASRYLTLNAPTDGGYITFEAGGTAFADMGSQKGLTASGDATSLMLASRSTFPLLFGTSGGTERMRIDSSGNLLVGTTSNYGGGRLDVAWDGTGNAAAVRASSASFVGAGFTVYADRNTTNSTFKGLAYYNVGAGAYKFIVQDSGNVQNTNNSYGAISDIKLKENIVDATPKLAQLNQVRVVNYNLIGDANKQLGVIAQELEQIFPGMVDESPDRDAEGNDLGTVTKSVKYSVFVPMLIKGLQELKAINDAQAQTINAQQTALESLTARVVALEGA